MSHTILFLAANPGGTAPRELDREARAIQAELERSGFRDQFTFVTRWAVEPLDLLRELRKLKPVVVHYSGHGGQDGLFFQDASGGSRLVATEALTETFGAAGASVKVVILSACYSEGQASALLEHVDCVIGMDSSIDADAARSFAIGFYGGLGERESVAAAYKQGAAAISLMGLRHSGRPQLKVRTGIDVGQLVLAEPSKDRYSLSHTPSTSRVDVPALYRKIVAQFPGDEINQLRVKLEEKLRDGGIEESISIDIVGGHGTPEIARNLISYLQRRGLLPYLVDLVDAGELILAEASAETRAIQVGTSTPAVTQPSRPAASKATPPAVDIGILTIRDDEFRAVLGAFPDQAGTFKGVRREYALRHADAGNGARYTVATLRLLEQGHGEAQDAARDLIDDLAPRLVLVVGIAGGLPSDDVTLGDVVVSTRIHDFTIEARKAGEAPTYAVTGGPVDKALAGVITNLAAREDELGNWTADLPARPSVSWTQKGQLYGPPAWQSELRAKLDHHHGKSSPHRPPVYAAGPIASSDRLVKDPELVIPWLQAVRNLQAIEMESGGVFRAVRERCPMLAIRGISDIVGLKRADAWTKYACASAAAFTRAFLRTRPIEVFTRTRDWHDDLTAIALGERLTQVARDLRLPEPAVALWQRLRQAAPKLPPTQITIQRWREVQPALDQALRARTANRIVFTSEGGVGKSFLLAELHDEARGARVWIDAVTRLNEVEQALLLGVEASRRAGVDLAVFVDAIEQASDPKGLLSAIHVALAPYERAAVFVGARFATWAQIRDAFPAWSNLHLERWNNDRVRAIAQARRAEPLSPDLVDLLRTPLLLHLFLETFGHEGSVPSGLATRHGVLRAYFERRVLPEADPRAGDRRAALDVGVASVLANAATWRDTTQASHDLVSDGVLTRVVGELRFRHALLRDFAAALQLSKQHAEQVAQTLAAIESPIIRNELLRGVIEAQLDPSPLVTGPTIAEIVRQCSGTDLAPGFALGATDAPTSALLTAIAPLDQGAVLRQAVIYAQRIDNRAWLRVPSMLGGERPAWLGAAQIEAMGQLAEFATATGDAAAVELATTLRQWTRGYTLGEENSRPVARIGSLLARTLIENETAEWYARLKLGRLNLLSPFLEPLRDLGAHEQIDEQLLFLALSRIIFEAGALVLQGGYSLWEVVHLCLTDHDEDEGLLTTRPSLGLSLLFALSVACTEEDERRRGALLEGPALARFLASLSVDQELLDAESRLRLQPLLTKLEATGDLVDDIRRVGLSLDEIESLLEEVERRATADLDFAAVLATCAIASRSMHARGIVLRLPRAHQVDLLVETILCDSRVYHFQDATTALWNAIHTRWQSLGTGTKAEVQRNILERARSPFLAISEVGRIASAIPRADLDADLVPYVELLESTGRSTTPERAASMQLTGSDENEDDESPVEAGDREAVSQWRRLDELSTQNDETAATESVALLRQLITHDGVGIQTPEATWFSISRILVKDYQSNRKLLRAAEVASLFESSMREATRPERREDAQFWGTLVHVSDGCLRYDLGEALPNMRRRLVDEIRTIVGEHAERERHAWCAVHFAGATWVDAESGGRALFQAWFRNYLHGDGLRAGLRLMACFPAPERVQLLRHVLESDGRFRTRDAARGFAAEAGKYFGTWSIGWDEAYAREAVRGWHETGRTGALADDQTWCAFLSGFAWCLQNEVRRVEPGPRVAGPLARFVPLLTLAWSAWSAVIDDAAEGNVSVGWSVTRPLARRYETRLLSPDGAWSISLRSLLPRVIAEGARNDIAALQQVDWSSIDGETLALAALSMITRADAEIARRPPGDWIIDSLVDALGEIGVAPTLVEAHANRVLDCLQRLGRSASRATTVAATVARVLRARGAESTRR